MDYELPDRIESQLELLHAMCENDVRWFAAGQLADLSPGTLRRIRSMIDEQLKALALELPETKAPARMTEPGLFCTPRALCRSPAPLQLPAPRAGFS